MSRMYWEWEDFGERHLVIVPEGSEDPDEQISLEEQILLEEVILPDYLILPDGPTLPDEPADWREQPATSE